MQKIVQGDSTKPISGSDKHSKVLMEEEVSNTDHPPVLRKDTRHLMHAGENRMQSPCSVRKSRSPSRADRRKVITSQADQAHNDELPIK